ncbi:hypothetical protein RAH41_19725 [Gottfriedia acidiceleris]|uniref:hypothetical protein n=1 Tax=Gottfriedia acidiceleris TaxID=371036 RepID=UPI002F266B6F
MGKRVLISAIIAALSVFIRSILRADGINNLLNENIAGLALIYLVIYFLIFFIFKKKANR